MISFLSPLFLAGALTAAVPIVLHLMRREPEPRVKFAPVKLLKEAPVELTEKRRLRELLLLAMRVAALILLAVAFARPFFASANARGSSGVTIVAVDTSYSMSAPGQFDRARQLARNAVARAAGGDLVGIVSFADEAEIVCQPTTDRAFALSALDNLSPGFGATRYRVGLNAAAQALSGRRGSIIVVTDLQESGWDVGDHASVPENTRIEVADAGPTPANLAITSVRVIGDRLAVAVRNAGPKPRETRVQLTLDGQPAGEAPIALPPNASAEATMPLRPHATTAAASIADPEGIPADNVRYAVLDAAGRPSLLVVTPNGDLAREAFYLQQALGASAAGAAGYDVVGASGAQLAKWDADRLSRQSAVLIVSTRGLERHGRELLQSYVRGGGGMIIAAGPDIDGEVVADVLGSDSPLRVVFDPQSRPEERALAPADMRHPLFRRFAASAATLGLVKFQRVARIGGSGCQTLARFTTGESAVIDCPAGEGRALVIASDLDSRWNDFPLHATFLPFVHEAVQYVANAKPRAAEYLVADVPRGVSPKPGIATLDAGPSNPRSRPRRVAINVDPRESDPSRISVDEFQSAVTRLKDVGAVEARLEARQQEDRQHLWLYLLGLMVAVLTIEGAAASRTA